MRNISKGKEPRAWQKHRCTPHANFDNDTAAKQKLRESLVNEQRGLCCYCMQRIRAEGAEMKVEHWACFDLYPNLRMTYTNFLGACQGNEGRRLAEQYCDTRKGDNSLSRNPSVLAHNVEGVIKYLANGRIESSDANFDLEINNVLNLNFAVLVNLRKGVLDALKASMSKPGSWDAPALRKKISDWRGIGSSGELRPFCQVVVYYLEKKLARGDL
jgi:uncharacterized protein (TIGR02646 family)